MFLQEIQVRNRGVQPPRYAKLATIVASSMFLAAQAMAANVITCADLSFAGKPVWPATGQCPNVPKPAGPGLLVAAVTNLNWAAQLWKPSAQIVASDQVFTDTADAAGSKWMAASAFMWTAAPPATTGTINLTWSVATLNVDDTPLTDLSGYQLYSGAEGATLGKLGVPLPAASVAYTVTGLAPGRYSFSITVLSAGNLVESAQSNVVTHDATMPVIQKVAKPVVLSVKP